MNTHLSHPADRGDGKDAPLDRARLADVLRGSSRSVPAFLAEFRRSTDADARQMLAAAASGDLAQVEQLAHRIEGVSRVLGAEPLAQACFALAQASRRGRAEALGPELDAFVQCKQALYGCIDALPPAAPTPGAGAGREWPRVCDGLVFLVVEDHEFQRGMIVRLLQQLGALEVHGFADGASALAAARQLRSAAVMVLDLAMPALNGMEVMRIAGLERLPVSVIMNSALDEDLLRGPLQTARSHGATVLGAVSKPLTAAKLAPLLVQYRRDRRADTPGHCAANDV